MLCTFFDLCIVLVFEKYENAIAVSCGELDAWTIERYYNENEEKTRKKRWQNMQNSFVHMCKLKRFGFDQNYTFLFAVVVASHCRANLLCI